MKPTDEQIAVWKEKAEALEMLLKDCPLEDIRDLDDETIEAVQKAMRKRK